MPSSALILSLSVFIRVKSSFASRLARPAFLARLAFPARPALPARLAPLARLARLALPAS